MSEKGVRPRRVAELVQAEISRLLIGEFQDAMTGLLTVTRVEMTADLRAASVFLSVLGPAGAAAACLDLVERRKGYIRKTLAPRLKLKYNPELFFALDPGAEHQARIDTLIEESRKHGR